MREETQQESDVIISFTGQRSFSRKRLMQKEDYMEAVKFWQQLFKK